MWLFFTADRWWFNTLTCVFNARVESDCQKWQCHKLSFEPHWVEKWQPYCQFFTHSKGDQEGVNQLQPWHIYANPGQPSICPILALAMYLFSNPSILRGDQKLFPGGNQYSRFTKSFQRALNHLKDDIKSLGVDVDLLGSHSKMKSAATLTACGCTVSPPMASICLRAK